MTDPSRSPLVKASAADQVSDLIERLENATGPQRELDADIHEEIAQVRVREIHPDDPPRYTASLDDALTLMPNAMWDWGVWHLCGHKHGAMIKAPDLSQWSCEGGAPNPAIALCIAALKAREQQQ